MLKKSNLGLLLVSLALLYASPAAVGDASDESLMPDMVSPRRLSIFNYSSSGEQRVIELERRRKLERELRIDYGYSMVIRPGNGNVLEAAKVIVPYDCIPALDQAGTGNYTAPNVFDRLAFVQRRAARNGYKVDSRWVDNQQLRGDLYEAGDLLTVYTDIAHDGALDPDITLSLTCAAVNTAPQSNLAIFNYSATPTDFAGVSAAVLKPGSGVTQTDLQVIVPFACTPSLQVVFTDAAADVKVLITRRIAREAYAEDASAVACSTGYTVGSDAVPGACRSQQTNIAYEEGDLLTARISFESRGTTVGSPNVAASLTCSAVGGSQPPAPIVGS